MRTAVVCLFCLGIACSGSAAKTESDDQAKPAQSPVAADPKLQSEIGSAIAAVDKEIGAAEAESAKYSGGLVKALAEGRIQTLKQTRAMLDQRAKSWTFGIGMRYTVDGKPFVPAPDAVNQLASVEAEIATAEAKATRQEAEAARYTGGLVQAMSLATAATTRQSLAMLEQKRLALKFGLPQYVGPAAPSTAPSSASTTAAVQPAPASTTKDVFEIAGIDAKVTESNNTWSRYAWKLTIRNKDSQPHSFDATIEFQDSDGFVVDDDNEYGLVVGPNSEQTFTGYALVDAGVAGKVARTNAKVGLKR